MMLDSCDPFPMPIEDGELAHLAQCENVVLAVVVHDDDRK